MELEELEWLQETVKREYPALETNFRKEDKFLHVWKPIFQGLKYLPNFNLIFQSHNSGNFTLRLITYHGRTLDTFMFKCPNEEIPETVASILGSITDGLKLCQGVSTEKNPVVKYECLIECLNDVIISRSTKCKFMLANADDPLHCEECQKLTHVKRELELIKENQDCSEMLMSLREKARPAEQIDPASLVLINVIKHEEEDASDYEDAYYPAAEDDDWQPLEGEPTAKRGRGRPKKIKEENHGGGAYLGWQPLDDEEEEEVDQRPKKKGRGRPRKARDDEEEKEEEDDDDEEDSGGDWKPYFNAGGESKPKKKRGRPRKEPEGYDQVVLPLGIEEDQTHKRRSAPKKKKELEIGEGGDKPGRLLRVVYQSQLAAAGVDIEEMSPSKQAMVSGHIFRKIVKVKCQICLKPYKAAGCIGEHVKSHSKFFDTSGSVECPVCQATVTKLSLTDHFSKEHSPEGDPKTCCLVCSHVMPNKDDNLRIHILKIHQQRFMCDTCGYVFANVTNLDCHMKTAHSDVKDFFCERCGKAFAHELALNKHVQVACALEEWKCAMCAKVFGCRKKIRFHLMVHCEEKPYACRLCAYRYIDEYFLLIALSICISE
jgi:hypothetical protein